MSIEPPVIVFAPGAGAGSDSPWMRAWSQRLAAIGAVDTLDYPYRLAGRKAPDKLPVLIAAHRQAISQARARHPRATRIVLVGKSMGGRVGCHAALEEPVDGIVCLGYPLRGTSGALRDEVLVALKTPVLFVQGTRDPLCPLDDLATVRGRMTAPNQLLVIEGGNHSLEVPRGRPTRAAVESAPNDDRQGDANARVVRAITDFVAAPIARRVGDQTDGK